MPLHLALAKQAPPKVVQAVLILLILVSTLNMLVESHTDCHYDSATYARVCEEVTWDDDQVANMGYVEAACIAAFSIEFLSRMFASPATCPMAASCAPVLQNRFWPRWSLS